MIGTKGSKTYHLRSCSSQPLLSPEFHHQDNRTCMTNEELLKLPAYQWMPSRIPLRDALSSVVLDTRQPDPILVEMSERCGQSVWFETEGGYRVLFLYDGGVFDTSRFTLESKVWDYDECAICGERIPAMTLCHVTKPGMPYVLLCASCYTRHATVRQAWWKFW